MMCHEKERKSDRQSECYLGEHSLMRLLEHSSEWSEEGAVQRRGSESGSWTQAQRERSVSSSDVARLGGQNDWVNARVICAVFDLRRFQRLFMVTMCPYLHWKFLAYKHQISYIGPALIINVREQGRAVELDTRGLLSRLEKVTLIQ